MNELFPGVESELKDMMSISSLSNLNKLIHQIQEKINHFQRNLFNLKAWLKIDQLPQKMVILWNWSLT